MGLPMQGPLDRGGPLSSFLARKANGQVRMRGGWQGAQQARKYRRIIDG